MMPSEAQQPAFEAADANLRPALRRPLSDRLLRLPDGGYLDLQRSRWAGVLSAAEVAACRAAGVPLAYDCAQLGWVPATCRDDDEVAPAAPSTWDATPLAAGQQLVDRWRRRIAAAGAPLAAGSASAWRREVQQEVAAHARGHGVRAADDCHLAIASLLASAAAGPAAPPAPAPFTFRRWQPADAPRYRELLDDPALWAYLPEPYPAPVTEELARQLIAVGAIDARQEALAVVHDGQPIGQCLLRFHEPRFGVRGAEVAYWLGRAHWGKGLMTQILARFLHVAFQTRDLDFVCAWIHADHAASARVASHCRFRRDDFAGEAELARDLKRPAFQRHLTHRADWVSVR